MPKLIKLAVSLLAAYTAAFVGSLATIPNIPSWYTTLDKPPFNPPNAVFGPVWTVLYTLIGVSLYLVWTSHSHSAKRWVYWSYGFQLALNALWSVVFFGFHLPWMGVVVIVILDVAIVVNVIMAYRHSHVAAYLLVPYLLWSCFATSLTVAIAILN